MFRIFTIFLFSSMLFFSCTENKKTDTDTVTLAKRDSIKVDTTYYPNGVLKMIMRSDLKTNRLNGRSEIYYPTGELNSVKYFYNDTAKGNYFIYFPNGKLKQFQYLVNNDCSVYGKEYDSTGKLIEELGNPFVGDHAILVPPDTLRIKIFVSNYGYRNILFEVSPNGEKYTAIELKKDDIEGTDVLKVWKSIAGLKRTTMYMKITCTDSLSKNKIYHDTLTFDL